MAASPPAAEAFSAWNPGIEPGVPGEFALLETIYRPEFVASSYAYLREVSRWSGLPAEELCAYLPERLALHELIVRLTAEVSVPEGDDQSIYGRNARRMAAKVYADYLVPQMAEIRRIHAELLQQAEQVVRELLDTSLSPVAVVLPLRRFPFSLFGRRKAAAPPPESSEDHDHRVVAAYRADGLATTDPLRRAIYKSLYRVLGGVLATHGRLSSERGLLVEVVTRHVGNHWGSELIGRKVASLLDQAIEHEGWVRIEDRESPRMISMKGASAAGKSSLRGLMIRRLRAEGFPFAGYVTISPDVWRRVLLDYASLGPAYKYAGYFTSRELNVIDAKLDRYLRDKANRQQRTPHLLVDRFRFDSFSSERVERVFQDTYARYVDTMHMVFVITAPEETVERGWQRGLQNGRYKAVEDFLGHCVEAYTGIPKLLFKWLASPRPGFEFSFLDNGVPKGQSPKLIARGDRSALTIHDPLAFINIERYQKIDIKARSPAAVYPPGPAMAVARNCGFLRECVQRIRRVEFVDGEAGAPYLQVQSGRFEVLDVAVFDRVMAREESGEILRTLAPWLDAPRR